MLKKNLLLWITLLVSSTLAYSQEKKIVVQISEPKKIIEQVESYMFGKGLRAPESEAFFLPLQKSFLTTIGGIEMMLGVKSSEILTILNGNLLIEIQMDAQKDVMIKAAYPAPEQATESFQILTKVLTGKGVKFIEKTDEVAVSTSANFNLCICKYQQNLYFHIGNSGYRSEEKEIVKEKLVLPKKDIGDSYISVSISDDLLEVLMENVSKHSPLTTSLIGNLTSFTISIQDQFLNFNTETNISNHDFLQSITINKPLTTEALNLAPQSADFAIVGQINFSNIVSNLKLFPQKEIANNLDKMQSAFQEYTKLNLQKDLLNYLGEAYVISHIPESEAGGNPLLNLVSLNSCYVAVTLKNSSAFENSLKTIMALLGKMAQSAPFAIMGDGVQSVAIENGTVHYIRTLQGALTPCFLIKDKVLFIASNVPTLEYINKNFQTWGSVASNKDFKAKVPIDIATSFFYEKYTGDALRPNYISDLASVVLFGGAMFCNYMGDPKINPGKDGEQFKIASAMLKPFVSNIDFARYPARKHFRQPYGDSYCYTVVKNNKIFTYSKNGHLYNQSTGLFAGVAAISVIATIAVPQLMSARKNANEKSAIGSLRSCITDQITYRSDNDKYATINQLKAAGKIDLSIIKSGYTYRDLIANPDAESWAVIASPVTWHSSGSMHIIASSLGEIRVCRSLELPDNIVHAKSNQEMLDAIAELNSEY